MLGMVTQTSVYHWSIEGAFPSLHLLEFKPKTMLSEAGAQSLCAGDSEPVKMFDRTANLSNNQIINYKCDPSEKWLVLIGIAPGSAEVCCYSLVKCENSTVLL